MIYVNNGIQITYPRTKYKKLGEAMYDMLQEKVIKFMELSKEPEQAQITYTFNISNRQVFILTF